MGQLAGSINQIDKIYGGTGTTVNVPEFFFWSVDVNVKYDLNMLVGDTGWFDPFVLVGGGYTEANKLGEGMFNIGLGYNIWLNENLGINYQTMSRIGFADKIAYHAQHALGLAIRFGGKDTDGDGVYDKDDACPEEAGLKEFNGCPDADGDGIKDSDDACPNVAGLASLNGWPDTDGDGVLDKDDKCPNEVGPASNNGCPEPVIAKKDIEVIEFTAKSILFNTGRSSFKAGVAKQLDAIAEIMKNNPKAMFAIGGHTDSTGSKAINQKLSEKRAKAVMDYLVKAGVDASRLTFKGYGEDNPVDDNKTRKGR